MSFRARLALFFVLIVVIPITAIAVLFVNVTGDAESGKADAQLSTALASALGLYERHVAEAERIGRDLLRDERVATALEAGGDEELDAALRAAAAGTALVHLEATAAQGASVVAIDRGDPLAASTIRTTGSGGGAELVASVATAKSFASDIQSLTGLEAAVALGEEITTTTAGGRDLELPASGESADTALDGRTVRAAAGELPEATDAKVVVFAEVETGGFFDSQPRVAIALAAFLALAIGLILLVIRTLQGQIGAMLEAARRIGSGDFSRRVPVVGGDEMASLAGEFNRMTERLQTQIEQLERQRKDLDRSVRRLGEAFASGLDRDALLAIVADTARESCRAEYSRISLEDGTLIERPEGLRGAARDAAVAGERRSRREVANVVAERDEGHALSAPLRRYGQDSDSEGTISVSRRGDAFSESERDLFLYLLGQASASIENISAHERVSELAVTDELTGLPNSRAFREAIEREAARAERFGHDLSLVILDVDDFKQVNDTHGHLQGDEVLRTIGRILDDEPRTIDEPARYGGEEFVVALPETGMEGALETAERIRTRLESEAVPMLEGDGALHVTASFGVASMPASASDVRGLFSAADEALYEAKRAGKNRVAGAQARNGAFSSSNRQ